MQVEIKPLNREDYEELSKLVKISEPFKGFQYYDQFCQGMDSRVGFTYWVDSKIVGVMSFTDYYPGISVIIHTTFHPEYPSAMNRKVIRHIFDYAFNKLLVRRITALSFPGITDKTVKFLERLGFKQEGRMREAIEIDKTPGDLELFGMLRKDCRWI